MLGVETFVRQSNVININFKKGPIVVVQLDPKKLTNTRDAFEKEALRYPDLSKETVNKVLLFFLMDASNGYLQYLLYNKTEELNGKNHKESSQVQILSGKRAAALVALKLAKQHCQDYFIDNLGRPYAAVKIDEHLAVLPIKGSKFKNWLCEVYYDFSTSKHLHKRDGKDDVEKNQSKVHTVDECFDKEGENDRQKHDDDNADEDLDADILNTEI